MAVYEWPLPDRPDPAVESRQLAAHASDAARIGLDPTRVCPQPGDEHRRHVLGAARPLAGARGGDPGKRVVDLPAGRLPLRELGSEPGGAADAPALRPPDVGKDILDRPDGKVLLAGQEEVDHGAEAEQIGPRPDRALIERQQLGGRVPGGAEQHPSERRGDPARSRDAEVCELEDLVGAEAAAENVLGLDVAVNDAHLVDRRQAPREALDRVRGARGRERGAGTPKRVRNAGRQGRALQAAVHVLERQPRQVDASGCEGERPRVEQPHHEGSRRDALGQPAEGDGFLLHQHGRVRSRLAHEGRPQDLDHRGRLTVRAHAEREEGDGHASLAQYRAEPIPQAMGQTRLDL